MIKVRYLNAKKQIVNIQIELYLRKKRDIDKVIVKGNFNGKDMFYINGKWNEAKTILVE